MFRQRIQKNYDGLTPGFRKIADFILQNAVNVAFLTADELAQQANVSQTTITGFCKELGYGSYETLAGEIRQSVHKKIVTCYEDTHALEEMELLNLLQNNFIKQLERFRATQTHILAEIVKVLKHTPRLWITGDHLGDVIAQVFSQGLQMLGKQAIAFRVTIAEMGTYLAQMQPGDVLVAIAVEPFGIDTSYVIKLAREKGIQTVCLAGLDTDLAAREAEIVLDIPHQSPVAPFNPEGTLAIVGLILEALVTQEKMLVAEWFTNTYTLYGQLCKMRAGS